MSRRHIKAIVIGASAGGVEALNTLFSSLHTPLEIPILVALHIPPHGSIILSAFGKASEHLKIKEAEDKEQLEAGSIYFAPPNYHLLIEKDLTLSLSVEEAVQFSRPSIDVLFESASIIFDKHLIGILLTGANSDGAKGLFNIHERKGLTIVQDPQTAPYPDMPRSALQLFNPTHVLSLEEIGKMINSLKGGGQPRNEVSNGQ